MRSLIAGKLAQGVEVSRIVDDISSKMTEMTRDKMISRKDITNIKALYNIAGFQKHADDGESVYLWVNHLQKESNNPILFYKPQSKETESENLDDSDFLLCIQTPFQRTLLEKFGHKMIFIDSTHKTTQYDFQLITVLVLDDYGEAVPVAWAISEKEDQETLTVFFDSVKAACGKDIATDSFMSDLAPNFYNATVNSTCLVILTTATRAATTSILSKQYRRLLKPAKMA